MRISKDDSKINNISVGMSALMSGGADERKSKSLILPVNLMAVETLSAGDQLTLDLGTSTFSPSTSVSLSLSLLDPSSLLSFCLLSLPIKSKLVRFSACRINSRNAVDPNTGIFSAPQDGVYRIAFSGMLMVGGESKLHLNILSKEPQGGGLVTQAAGFVKLEGEKGGSLTTS